jgi:hypothetical protein
LEESRNPGTFCSDSVFFRLSFVSADRAVAYIKAERQKNTVLNRLLKDDVLREREFKKQRVEIQTRKEKK